MIPENILDFEFGKLNYAVALEVFEYQPDRHSPGRFLRGNTSFCPRDYSRDVHAAFDVVKEMKKKGWLFILNNEGEQREATFCRDGKESINVVDVTTESAICKAALLAVLGEK
ncbi:hypothetical protein RE628_16450 [Paenibacillus sp. D2_2]|uniref:BC1872 family protein n=1 Tax=Paenibacillus sp. D2_2 TaxID=3073092 RepID=UPI0028155A54|nr:hypothetical protein [Paenibacillus sp. D2_2]WMT39094.1 hypothetical protein RE628_16450 [Paenibacillus sp. D2_2]